MKSSDRKKLLVKFGANLRTLRKEAGLSQESLALEAGLDRTYIGGAERGERNVSLANLVQIAKAINVPLSKLLNEIDQ